MTQGKDPMYMYTLYISNISLCGVKPSITLDMSLTSEHISLVFLTVFYTETRTHFVHSI